MEDQRHDERDLTLTLHGLDEDNGKVRADVFVEKFRILLGSLKSADKFANDRKKSHDYIIETLTDGSIRGAIREKVSAKKRIPAPSIPVIRDVVNAIYNGEKTIERFPLKIIHDIELLTKGVGKRFSHGEVGTGKDNLVRIDDYLAKQANKAADRFQKGTDAIVKPNRFFEGVSLVTLDGVVKEMDARGQLVRGKLILTAGGKEIDCIFRRDDLFTLKQSFDLRARVEALAHYDGESMIPVRLDVKRIILTQDKGDLLRWRNALTHKSKRRQDLF